MYPRLFSIGPFTIYSFGLMMAVGFISASILLTRELRRKGYDPNMGSTITLIAALAGILGSKLLYIIEEWNNVMEDPVRNIFSPGGLTWFGGFFLAALAIWLYTRRRSIPFADICDATAPGLLLGYGVARIGCHLSGDGDYGLPTTLPWGQLYSHGSYKPHSAVLDYFSRNPEAAKSFNFDTLSHQIVGRDADGIITAFDTNVRFHPTPLYEFILAGILFLILWKLRTRIRPAGRLFMLYLVFAGFERFLVECVRLNPHILLQLSEAQLISILLIITGTIGWYFLSPSRERPGTP
jgi:phosphatidylglycerol---prolipoprotein diacylglyceryl transferase